MPTLFNIGALQTKPLVSVAQVEGHLSLLKQFASLRSSVEGLSGDKYARLPVDKAGRWTWFVGLAVERFTKWCLSLTELDIVIRPPDLLPPIDVMMVWHAYMLNPGSYSEDVIRIPKVRILGDIGDSVISHVLSTSYIPTYTAQSVWVSRTSSKFDPWQDAEDRVTKAIQCPICRSSITVAFLSDDNTGYLRKHFSATCTSSGCSWPITKAMLNARKIAEDLVRNDGTARSYLAGIMHSNDIPNEDRNKAVNNAIKTASTFKQPKNASEEEWVQHILKKNNYDLEKILRKIALRLWTRDRQKIIERIRKAYEDDSVFSVGLVEAVIRQASFIEKLDSLGWTEPSFFSHWEDKDALEYAIARYHAFLDLLTMSKTLTFVPTLDTDLVWHTHQLMTDRYGNDCEKYVKRFIDHDDTIREETLRKSFEATVQAWQNRFYGEYTSCGCWLPKKSRETFIKRLLHVITFRSSQDRVYQYFDWFTPKGDDLLAATHPTEYRPANFMSHIGFANQARQRKLAQRAKEAAEEARRVREEEERRKEAQERLKHAFQQASEPKDRVFTSPVGGGISGYTSVPSVFTSACAGASACACTGFSGCGAGSW